MMPMAPSCAGAGHKAAGAGAGGSIVLISAALASHGLPNFEAMSAAKAGVEGGNKLMYTCSTAVAAVPIHCLV